MGSYLAFSVILTASISTYLNEIEREHVPADALRCENCIELETTTAGQALHFFLKDLFKSVFGGERIDPESELRQITPSKVEPELKAVLTQWETKSREAANVTFDFTRQEFNNIFHEENRTKGQFKYRNPRTFAFTTEAWNPKPNEFSKGRGPDGKPFQIVSGTSETWIWTDREAILTNHEDKTFQAGRISDSPWLHWLQPPPFLFEINSIRLRKEWDMRLISKKVNFISIDATPRTSYLKRCYQRCRVIIDTSNYFPVTVQMLDHSGMEIRYRIQNWHTDEDHWDWESEFESLKSLGYDRVPDDTEGLR